MKKLKLFLCLSTIIVLVASCAKNESELNEDTKNSFDYAEIDTQLKNYSNSINDLFLTKQTIKSTFNESFKVKQSNTNTLKSFSSKTTGGMDAQQVFIELPAQLGEATNSMLLQYYNDMVNAYDYEIPAIVSEYQHKLDTSFLMSEDEKLEFQIILNASKYAIEALEQAYLDSEIQNTSITGKGGGFWDCMKRTAGKKIGRGMVFGAVTGAIGGGIVGAAGGTVAFPGLGTATGAVGGAVFGGASGAIRGAVGGAIWAAADCLTAVKSVELEFIVFEDLDKDTLTFDASIFELPEEQAIELLLND
ncbi:hypothetical protein H7U19_08505 [Hyunsoonleella sp. SJ7]|uniref:Glycine zipper family protein n=1 Tax=Hyunsoonleella aquatilis TaxID=2762758 RepID=A0A923HC75_9FLAO|nr:hypothetical protein [Hyunsoonleella aquatilis]MBC3758441.1 hypothetical protein [Hyunsoonleella aquatilis]